MDALLFFEELHKFTFLKKKPKRSQKVERSQTKFLVAKQCQKKPKSRNLALLTPSWQPCKAVAAFVTPLITRPARAFCARAIIQRRSIFKLWSSSASANSSCSSSEMECLHGKPASCSTTKNGSFWFCGQQPSCGFICTEDEGFLFQRALAA